MTLKNSVLLMIKQSPGIDYNDLLARISSRYKNPSSANSALNRVIKDMTSFGSLKKENNKLFLTDKGSASISIEMKDKLIMRLNEEMKKSFPNPSDIVQLLVVLYQRSSASPDLLNNAKQNATFTINDIENLRKKISDKRRYLKKMSLLLKQQSEKLKELDFNDSSEFVFDKDFISKAVVFCGEQKMVVEIKDEELLLKIPEHWKKQNSLIVEKESIQLLLQLILSIPSAKATIYLPGIKSVLFSGKIICYGTSKIVNSFTQIQTPDNAKVILSQQTKTNPTLSLATLLPSDKPQDSK